jgi:hypothetical protein
MYPRKISTKAATKKKTVITTDQTTLQTINDKNSMTDPFRAESASKRLGLASELIQAAVLESISHRIRDRKSSSATKSTLRINRPSAAASRQSPEQSSTERLPAFHDGAGRPRRTNRNSNKKVISTFPDRSLQDVRDWFESRILFALV